MNKFEIEIKKDKNLIEKLKSLYELIISISDIHKHTNIFYLDDIIDLLNKGNEDSDQDLCLKMLTGRKKSRNIASKKDYLEFKTKKKAKFDINEWNPKIIAKQLTLISYNLYSNIETKEFLNACWTKKNKLIDAPNIFKLIDRFNLLTYWVVEEVLSYNDKNGRAECIEKLIKVSECLLEMNNFNDCMNIIVGLSHYILKNLKQTWDLVSITGKNSLNELLNLSSCTKNFSNLRNAQEKCKNEPCLPYLLLYLKDLAFLEETCKYVNNEYLVNVEKIIKVGDIIDSFVSFRANVYLFRNIPELDILRDPRPKTEAELEKISDEIGIFFSKKFFLIFFYFILLEKLENEWKYNTNKKEKKLTNTDSRHFCLNPDYSSFLVEEFNSAEKNISNFLIEDYFK